MGGAAKAVGGIVSGAFDIVEDVVSGVGNLLDPPDIEIKAPPPPEIPDISDMDIVEEVAEEGLGTKEIEDAIREQRRRAARRARGRGRTTVRQTIATSPLGLEDEEEFRGKTLLGI